MKQPVINVRTPVRRNDDAFIGALIATVGVGDLVPGITRGQVTDALVAALGG